MPRLSIVFALLLAMLFPSQEGGFPEPKRADLEVTFLNVGVCDGILIRMGEEAAFIDGGSYPEGEFCRDYLLNAGVERLKYYIGTHSHSDHVAAAAPIMAAIPTDEVLMNTENCLWCMRVMARTDEERSVIENAKCRCIGEDETVYVGDAAITRIWPESYVQTSHYNDIKENENSLILRVSLDEVSFILTADTSSYQLFKLLEKDEDALSCTVIKGPHHGGGFHKLLFKYMKADYIVYSTASISPPKPDQRERAEALAKRIFITGDKHDGAVTFLTDGSRLTFSTSNGGQGQDEALPEDENAS